MNNQAAQTMPELPDPAFVTPDDNLYTVHQMRAMYRQGYDAALAQTAGVHVADDEVLVALRRGEGYEDVHPQLVAEDAIDDRWPEWRIIAAAPAASGGEDDMCPNCVTPWKCNGPHTLPSSAPHPDALEDGTLSKSTAKRVTALASASVSERARELADEWRHVLDDGEDGHELCASRNTVARFVNAIDALEQALTQQRGHGEAVDRDAWAEALELPEGYTVEEFLPGGWHYAWTRADGERMVSGTTWNHPALAAIAAWQCAPATTPQPSADAVRELVQRWRDQDARKHSAPGDRSDCADELESLLSAASGEKGVDE